MLLCTILFPILAGVAASVVRMDRRTRRSCYMAVMLVTDVLGLASMTGGAPMRLIDLAQGAGLYFALDGLGRWFLGIILVLFTAVLFYAFAYMEVEEREEAFFAFYFVALGCMAAVCMAGNLPTMYLCFELVTLGSLPLVLHERTKEAVMAGLKYLFYSIGGALLGLLAIVCLYVWGGGLDAFVPGGFLSPEAVAEHGDLLRWAVFLGIVGFGAKAGLYPLHGWLPAAHPAAPAPASALLSGVVAKMGVLAVIRLVFYAAGPDLLRGTWAQTAWTCLALTTVFMGSMLAFWEKVMKRRLAYSTISQISYIMAGLSLLDAGGLAGGLIHVAAHAAAKGTLFLCAGVFIFRLGKRDVRDLRGVGKVMPVTMWCFTLASLSLVGIPPMGGFVSKWMISLAALDAGRGAFAVLVPAVLLVSALLTAGYLLPVAVDAFFPGKEEGEEKKPAKKNKKAAAPASQEPPVWMTVPMAVLSAGSLAVGLLGSYAAELLGGVLEPLF